MTTKEKAVKILEEMISVQEKENLNWQQAAELTKKHYKLNDKQFSGLIVLAMS